jgi:hypothetical protein
MHELRREKFYSGWRQRTVQISSCRREFSPDRIPNQPFFGGLAMPPAGCGPQRFLRMVATPTKTDPASPGERSHHWQGAGSV